MTMPLERTPHVAASVAAQARACGVSLDTDVRHQSEVRAAVDHRGQPMPPEPFEAERDALAADSETWPSLPAEALTRVRCYRDHG
jgi:hypothetical protein